MEARWKTQWHVGSQNQKIFSRRKIIVNMIYNYARRKGVSNDVAVKVIEEKRREKK
jgi:hypothetical protein